MQQVTHWASFAAGAAIAARKIVHIASDGDAEQAVAATSALIGVSGSRAVPSGETVEVAIAGIAEVKLGGTVDEGNWVKADASGDGIAAGTDKQGTVGICVVGGVDGDIGSVLIAPGFVAA